MKVNSDREDWGEIVYCGIENQQIDFKSPQDWNEIGRVGRAKFARHAIALANSLGGYIIVGVGEDENGNPTNYIGMTEAQSASFDPSVVGQTINRYADPAVSIDIVRPELDGKRYVIIVVHPFSGLPCVCGDACDGELQRGVFYIRTPDARSRAAVRASELHALIQHALRNQRQMLGRMLRGILYEDRQADTTQEAIVFPPLLERSRRQAREKLGNEQTRVLPLFESIFHGGKPFKGDTIKDGRRAFETLERPGLDNFPWPDVSSQSSIYATNESLCGQQFEAGTSRSLCFWEYYQNGLFYCATPLPLSSETPRAVDAHNILKLTAVSIILAGQLYSNLNHQDAILTLSFRLANSNMLRLSGLPKHERDEEFLCQILDIDVSKERSAADLEAGAATDTATQIFMEICERFNASFDNADEAEIQLLLSRETKQA